MSDETRGGRDAVDRLRADLDRLPNRIVGLHLTNEEVADYSIGALDTVEGTRLDAHLSSCMECTSRLEHLMRVAEAWKDAEGDERVANLSSRILNSLDAAPPRRARWSWDGLIARLGSEGFPLSPSIAGALGAAPSSLRLGGEPAGGSKEWGRSILPPPVAYALSRLYAQNDRTLPDAAEIFWGHEIWLVLVPCLVEPGPDTRIDAIGLSLTFPADAVDVLDAVPRRVEGSAAGAVESRAVFDVGWNGRFITAAATPALDSEARPLAYGASLTPARDAALVGRLEFSSVTDELEGTIVGVRTASFSFRPGHAPSISAGCVGLLVLADKFLDALDIHAQIWAVTRGVNDVAAHVASDHVVLQAKLQP